MAETRKRRHSISIDDKISAEQEKPVRTKGRYEKAVETLKALPGFAWLCRGECENAFNEEEFRRKEPLEAVMKSDHTYEEILCFIRG